MVNREDNGTGQKLGGSLTAKLGHILSTIMASRSKVNVPYSFDYADNMLDVAGLPLYAITINLQQPPRPTPVLQYIIAIAPRSCVTVY